jgi:hypothetical protein
VTVLAGHHDAGRFARSTPDLVRAALPQRLPASLLQRNPNITVLLRHLPETYGSATDGRPVSPSCAHGGDTERDIAAMAGDGAVTAHSPGRLPAQPAQVR